MNTKTQCQAIVDWMSAGRSVTTLLAMSRWRICRLSERIRECERMGHKISRDHYRRNGKRWTSYRLARYA